MPIVPLEWEIRCSPWDNVFAWNNNGAAVEVVVQPIPFAWSAVAAVSTSYSVMPSASSSYSAAALTSSSFTDFNDLGGYVEAGYVIADYVIDNIWSVVPGVSGSWGSA